MAFLARAYRKVPAAEPSAMKRNPNAPHIARLQAIMDVLGFTAWGDQARFSKEIGINPNNFNHVMKGSPLSTTIAFAIFKPFGISLDFMYFGVPYALPSALEQKLREWERCKGRRIFMPPGQ